MNWIERIVVFSLSCSALSGCGRMSDQERLKVLVPNAQKTIPVTGKVLVDGEPVKDLWVTLHSENTSADSLQPKAQTDENGDFKITSYIGGDGAPQGNYKITVQWLKFQQFGSQWVGPDKLDGPNGDVKTTELTVAVADKPVTLPTFEVKAKADADKPPPPPVSRRGQKKKKT